MKKIILLLLVSSFFLTAKSQVVISQVYGGGGNSGATYKNDFIELFNRGNAAVDLTGWSVQYNSGASSGATAWQKTDLVGFVLQPGQYYLVQEAQGAGGTVNLPTPDATGTIAMSGTSGKVALVNNQTLILISAPCPIPTASIIDFVGYGTSNCSETTPTAAPSNTTSVLRALNGCTDTDVNSADFATGAPNPRNTGTTLNPCGGGSPTLTASALTGFGNVCINTISTANSFTITGTTLTAANVTVGALPGFTYDTTGGIGYVSSLSIPHAVGAFSKQIFVKFNPTLVQSYNGNIAIGGGGATGINVAATGAGINPAPVVTTGAASAITTVSAILAGNATTACAAITAYGIEYSLVNGFTPGTGTQAGSSNINGSGDFTSAVAGLVPSTIYYYRAYATNTVNTIWGNQQQFTTATPSTSLSASALTGFGTVCINTITAANSFTITGVSLSAANVTVGALAGFTYDTTGGIGYVTSLSIPHAPGAFSKQIFVKFNPLLVQSYSGNIPIGGGGAPSINVAATGAGVNTIPTLTTGAASAITTNSATLAGTITGTGCTAVTAYGVEYSLTPGFINGTGTFVASTNLSGSNFSSNLITLSPNTTYYYHAMATNAGGTGYGAEQFFTTQALTPTLSATGLASFNSVCINTTSAANSFTINGSALTNANVNVAALTGFTYSLALAGSYTNTLTIPQPGGTLSVPVYVKFTPTAVISYNGNIVISGGGAPSSVNVAAVGAGINTIPTLTTGAASAITAISATAAGTITGIGCSAILSYGIEYSTINGFTPGTGTQVASGNLGGGNFSSNLTGLVPSTIYYYRSFASNNGGFGYGAQQSFTTATPLLSVGAITAFGNVCTNATVTNSFTITGTNLTTANVTLAALAGFTYSTSLAGVYSATLSLPQTSGPYSQLIYVKFSPVAVISYSGNIVVGGGGAASVNRSVTGAGINTAATVTSGAASAITQTTATLAGTIPSIGCTAVTVYGVEYSLIAGFSNGTGIPVVSTNLIGTNFSSNLTGLIPSTTYYYHAYATNGGGTTYGTERSFTTSAPVLTATTLLSFGAVCINTTVGPNSFTISSNALLAPNVNVGPRAGFSFSTTAGGTYSVSLSLPQVGGGAAYSQIIYVKFTPVAVLNYNGNIPVSGGGAPVTINVAASGSGINTVATVVTGNALILSPNAVTLDGSITSIGCSPAITYGIEYSGIAGLQNGLGTQVQSTNLNAGAFSVPLNGLVQGATYYYKAWAINNGGIAYGVEKSFTTTTIPDGLVLYSNPLPRCGNLHVTLKGIKPGHYAAQVLSINGQLVFQKDMIIQVNFIDENIKLPCYLGAGVYWLQIANPYYRNKKRFMIK